MARKKLGELLVQAGAIDDLQLRAALGEQRKWGRPLGAMLIEMRLIDEKTLVHVLSHQLNIPAVDLDATSPSSVAMQFLDGAFCAKNQCFPFRHIQKGNFLDVAMADPTKADLFDRIRLETRCNIRPYLAGPVALDATIRRYYLGQAGAAIEADNRPWMVQSRPDEPVYDGDRMGPAGPVPAAPPPGTTLPPAMLQQVEQLRQEVVRITALLDRDEKVIRKLMALLVEKGICTKQELMARLNQD
jgi:type IV pilus assembly protein PilB